MRNKLILMKNTLLFLIGICIVVLFCRCPIDAEYRLEFYNLTNDTLDVYLAFGHQTAYPDTTLPVDPNKASIGGASPHKTGLIWISDVPYEKAIKGLPKDTLSVFIFNADTLKAYNWKVIRMDYKILVRYDLSLTDLQILNFTIPYPPSKTMKGMKMYPAYEE